MDKRFSNVENGSSRLSLLGNRSKQPLQVPPQSAQRMMGE
jgi:hypothetical protein